MFPDTSGTLRDPGGNYFFSCNGGKTSEGIKTLIFGQYFAWQVEKGERKTTSVPAVRLCNLVQSQNRNTLKRMFPTWYRCTTYTVYHRRTTKTSHASVETCGTSNWLVLLKSVASNINKRHLRNTFYPESTPQSTWNEGATCCFGPVAADSSSPRSSWSRSLKRKETADCSRRLLKLLLLLLFNCFCF